MHRLVAVLEHLHPNVVVFEETELERRLQTAAGGMAFDAFFAGKCPDALPGQVETELEALDSRVADDPVLLQAEGFFEPGDCLSEIVKQRVLS